MAAITRLVASGSRVKKVRVYLDGEYAFSLQPEVALEAGLRPGQELEPDGIAALEGKNRKGQALACAGRLLSFRPRSEKEIRLKLMQKGFSSSVIEETVGFLKDKKLLDDESFARYWAENRSAFSPRSGRMVQLELRQKGVKAEVADGISHEVDDEVSAYRSGMKKASRLAVTDYDEFRRKLGEYLRRRGFAYDVIDRSVKRLWQETAHKE